MAHPVMRWKVGSGKRQRWGSGGRRKEKQKAGPAEWGSMHRMRVQGRREPQVEGDYGIAPEGRLPWVPCVWGESFVRLAPAVGKAGKASQAAHPHTHPLRKALPGRGDCTNISDPHAGGTGLLTRVGGDLSPGGGGGGVAVCGVQALPALLSGSREPRRAGGLQGGPGPNPGERRGGRCLGAGTEAALRPSRTRDFTRCWGSTGTDASPGTTTHPHGSLAAGLTWNSASRVAALEGGRAWKDFSAVISRPQDTCPVKSTLSFLEGHPSRLAMLCPRPRRRSGPAARVPSYSRLLHGVEGPRKPPPPCNHPSPSTPRVAHPAAACVGCYWVSRWPDSWTHVLGRWLRGRRPPCAAEYLPRGCVQLQRIQANLCQKAQGSSHASTHGIHTVAQWHGHGVVRAFPTPHVLTCTE